MPNDPRGELRWCLSKIRSSSTSPAGGGSRPPATPSGSICRTASSTRVEIARATQEGIETLAPERLRTLAALFNGDFSTAWRSTAARLSTAGSPRSAAGSAPATPPCWSTSSRSASGDEAFGYLEQVARARAVRPARPRGAADRARAATAAFARARSTLAATARLFEAEGLDAAPICATPGGPAERRPTTAPRVADRAARGARQRQASGRADIAVAAAAPRLDRGDAVRRPQRRDRPRAAGRPTRSPTT